MNNKSTTYDNQSASYYGRASSPPRKMKSSKQPLIFQFEPTESVGRESFDEATVYDMDDASIFNNHF